MGSKNTIDNHGVSPFVLESADYFPRKCTTQRCLTEGTSPILSATSQLPESFPSMDDSSTRRQI